MTEGTSEARMRERFEQEVKCFDITYPLKRLQNGEYKSIATHDAFTWIWRPGFAAGREEGLQMATDILDDVLRNSPDGTGTVDVFVVRFLEAKAAAIRALAEKKG